MAKKKPNARETVALSRRNFIKTVTVAAATMESLMASDKPCRLDLLHPTNPRGQEIAEMARTIKMQADIPFAKRPERTLLLDVYSPQKRAQRPLPAIVTFGLAAWVHNTKDFCMDLDHVPAFPTPYIYPPAMVPHGFVVVSADIRVASEAKFPAQIHDCKCATQWIRAHAQELDVDPDRIGVIGGSASGYLAAMLALTRPEDGFEDAETFPGVSSNVQAAYSGSGMYDFEYYHSVPGEASLPVQIGQFLGGTYEQVPEIYRKASPTQYVRPWAPPFLLMHGVQDRRVPYEQQTHFVEILAKAGVPTQAIYINHMSHAVPKVPPDPAYTLTDQTIYNFFEHYLKKQVA